MACNIAFGRLEPCKDSVGGLKAIYIANFDELAFSDITFSGTDGEISGLTFGAGEEVYKYELRGNSTFEQNIVSSRENGTTTYEQVLSLTLKKLTPKTHKELKLLVSGRPKVFVEDNNGNYFLAGAEFGLDVTAGTIVTGGAMGDLSGYTLTLNGMESAPAEFLDSTAVTTLTGVISSSTISDI